MGAAHHSEFSRKVLNPLRRQVRKLKLGLAGERLLSRLNRKNVHLTGLVQTFLAYALLVNQIWMDDKKLGTWLLKAANSLK